MGLLPGIFGSTRETRLTCDTLATGYDPTDQGNY